MGTRVVRILCGLSFLLWPLLLLLPLGPKAGPVLKPGVPSPSKVPGVAPGRPGLQQGLELSASGHQDYVSGAQGPFERQWASDGWRPYRKLCPSFAFPLEPGGLKENINQIDVGSPLGLTLYTLESGVMPWVQNGV